MNDEQTEAYKNVLRLVRELSAALALADDVGVNAAVSYDEIMVGPKKLKQVLAHIQVA